MDSCPQLARTRLDAQRQEVGDGPFGDAPIRLVVDQTGVGRPVVDLLREHGLDPIGVTIHGGDQVLCVGANDWRVPKRTLVSSVQVALQTRRLQAAAALPEWPTLHAELASFRAKISLTTGHDTYEAGDDWRSRPHDDLVLALALAVWASAAIPVSASLAGVTSFVVYDDPGEAGSMASLERWPA